MVHTRVDDVRQIHKQTVVGACVRAVRSLSFVCPEFVYVVPINYDAVTWQWSGDVHPASDCVKFLILKGVWVYREVDADLRRIGIFGLAVAGGEENRQRDKNHQRYLKNFLHFKNILVQN